MRTAEAIMDEIAQLPRDEQAKVVEFCRRKPNAETLEAIREPKEGLPRFKTVEALFEELRSCL